jgi:hypothetical protein
MVALTVDQITKAQEALNKANVPLLGRTIAMTEETFIQGPVQELFRLIKTTNATVTILCDDNTIIQIKKA